MAGQEGTKFQINYKLSDGTLINLYAATVMELESGLADIAMNALNIKKTGVELGATVAPHQAPTVATIAEAFNATPVAAVAATGGSGNVCKHGEMNLVTGTSTKGPWSAYMCSTPKGSTDKCEPIWLR